MQKKFNDIIYHNDIEAAVREAAMDYIKDVVGLSDSITWRKPLIPRQFNMAIKNTSSTVWYSAEFLSPRFDESEWSAEFTTCLSHDSEDREDDLAVIFADTFKSKYSEQSLKILKDIVFNISEFYE